MRTRAVSEEVLYPDERIVIVDRDDIDALKGAADETARRRARLCTHRDTGDTLHEMLIVHTRDTYIRPHRQQRGRSESLHVIEGELDVVLLNDDGAIMTVIVMGEFRSGKPFYYRVAESLYHTLLIRSEAAVFHEITNGPFRPGDTEFASWAPAESDAEAVRAFQADLEKRVARQAAPAARLT
jgi:cupin fold WbuC family metalloprotein